MDEQDPSHLPPLLELLEKLRSLQKIKRKNEETKLNLEKEIKSIDEKMKILEIPISPSPNQEEPSKKEQIMALKLMNLKDQQNNFDSLAFKLKDIVHKKEEIINLTNELQKEIDQISILEEKNRIKLESLDNQLMALQNESEINAIKNSEMSDRSKEFMQTRKLLILEIENLIEKIKEARKSKTINKVLLKNQSQNVESLQNSLLLKMEEISEMIKNFRQNKLFTQNVDLLNKTYNEKVLENNKLRTANENLKQKIQKNSITNLQTQIRNHFTPKKKEEKNEKTAPSTKKELDSKNIDEAKTNFEKMNKVIMEINRLHIKHK